MLPHRSTPSHNADGHAAAPLALVRCYLGAASEVLEAETGQPVAASPLHLERSSYTSEDVTAMIGVSGRIAGSFYLSMDNATALRLVSRMLGQPVRSLGELAQSGVAELANVIAGSASVRLAEQGYPTSIAPPLLLVGAGALLSSVEIRRLVATLETSCGRIGVHIALREG